MTREEADALDRDDPLRGVRTAFDLPGGVLYLDGNSLGPPPRPALAASRACADEEWRSGLVRSWNEAGWIALPKRAGAKIARLIGVSAEDVIVCDSVSVNLFKLAGALLARRPGRALAVFGDEFPTDQYVLEGLSALTGAPLLRLREGETFPERSVVVRSLVHYKTAAVADMAASERTAAACGADLIWDLSHATGVLALNLSRDGARFAVGCGYKYLNGGPGAPAFLHVRADEAAALRQPIAGWMGAKTPFDFSSVYEPAGGVARFAAGTPPILSLSALNAALDIFDGLDLPSLERKARALGDMFLTAGEAAGLIPIRVAGRRGGHVAFRHPDGYTIVQALIARGVIGDFRAPDILRFGFSPLYLSYGDVWQAGEILQGVMARGEFHDPAFARRSTVT
ncbi:MAG: kynureninase [Parvularculaceae bacterium]